MIFRNLRTLWCSERALDDKLLFGKLQSVEKVKELHFAWAYRKSLHQLQDAVCQQVRALIDLRLPNCTLIKERPCSVPFLLLIWTFYLFGFGMDTAGLNVSMHSGNVWCACVSLFAFRRFLFMSWQDLRGGWTAGSRRPQRVTEKPDIITDRRRETRQRGEGEGQINWGWFDKL